MWILIVYALSGVPLPPEQYFNQESCEIVRDNYIEISRSRVRAVCVEIDESDK